MEVEPYNITCQWNDGQTLVTRLEKSLMEWSREKNSVFAMLLDKNIFASVFLDTESKTLAWPGLLKMDNGEGQLLPVPLDLDPEVLFSLSMPAHS